GSSAIGISVLSVRGWVEDVENTPVDLRLDSCADISLVSEDYLCSLKSMPAIHKGRKMSLAQLTDAGTSIKGYVRLRMLMLSKDGEMLSAEAELYMVKGMSVPLLLGEDFQQNYELSVARNVERGTTIRFGGYPYEVEASGVNPPFDLAEIHALTARLTMTVRVSEDVLIKAHSTRLVRVDGNFGKELDQEWLVDKQLLANTEDSFFSVPPTLVTARKPVLPVSNLSNHPRYLRRGELLGELTDPALFFDSPQSEDKLLAFKMRAALVNSVI
ncbi:hypothetical protein K438DRAFT_1546930, partial [Mycena galopus ATCC 62051]